MNNVTEADHNNSNSNSHSHNNQDSYNNNMESSSACSSLSSGVPLVDSGTTVASFNKINESRRFVDSSIFDTMDMDPDTDNEQHARRLLMRSRAKSSSISHSNSIANPYGEGYYKDIHLIGPIVKLPPEILLLIFSYLISKSDLISLSLTCRHWCNLIIDSIWFRPSIQSRSIFEKLREIMEMSREETQYDYRQYIKRLNLSLVPSLVTDSYLDLFVGCSNLERITLVNCQGISHDHISSLLIGCSRLQSIDLTGVKDIEDDIYEGLATNCTKLQGLYAPGSNLVSKASVMLLIDSCPLLKRVKLGECTSVDDEVVIKLVNNCPNLVEIDLQGCSQVTNKSLNLLFYKLEFLKEFKISKNANISYECFESDNCTPLILDRLRILDFTHCENITDRAIKEVVKLAPKLRNVVLSKCVNITDASLRAISTLGRNLHYIHLGHCSNITDFGAKELIKSCHRLQYIDLACCTQLTNETVFELATLPRLRRIGLVKCSQISDEGILALAENARNLDETLERVHLSYCMNLTVYPIFKLLTACPKLTHISLTGVSPFLRPDITKFCRDPPEDFSVQQKQLFCVFSGEGVTQLRNHLISLYDSSVHTSNESIELNQIIRNVVNYYDENEVEIHFNISNNEFNVIEDHSRRSRNYSQHLNKLVNDHYNLNISQEDLLKFCRLAISGYPVELRPLTQRVLRIFHEYRNRQDLIRAHQFQQQLEMDANAEPPNIRARMLYQAFMDRQQQQQLRAFIENNPNLDQNQQQQQLRAFTENNTNLEQNQQQGPANPTEEQIQQILRRQQLYLQSRAQQLPVPLPPQQNQLQEDQQRLMQQQQQVQQRVQQVQAGEEEDDEMNGTPPVPPRRQDANNENNGYVSDSMDYID